MWRSSLHSIIRQSKHFPLYSPNSYNPFLYSVYTALLCHNPPISGPQKVCSSPQILHPWNKDYVFGPPFRKFCYACVANDDVMIEGSSRESIIEEKSVIDVDVVCMTIKENVASGKNMEQVLEQMGIPLTTQLVQGVLHRLRLEEKMAFRFFMWAGCQEHYQHEYGVYNEMIDILSGTKFKLKQFRIVCDMLDYMKRNGKKSVPVDVLLGILKTYTEKHLTEVKKCSRKKKRFRVKKLPEVNALNLLLEALCKCCLVGTAESMFKKVRSKIEPDVNTFKILFFGWCRVRNPTKGMKILEEMSSMGYTPDSFTFNTAIDTFCREGKVNEASELFKFMKAKSSLSTSPNAKTYAIMILALVKSDKVEECFTVVEDMIQSGCLPDVATYKELIEGMCLAGKLEEAYRFLEEMAKKGFPPDIVTYNCFLRVLCDNKMVGEALRLYDRMIEVGCMPSVHSFNMLIDMFFAISDPNGAFDVWNEMDKRGCYRDTNTYCVMIEGLFGCGKIDDACFLLEELVNKGIKLPYQRFDLFLTHLSATGNLGAIHSLSEHMRSFYNPGMARRFALSQKRQSLSLRGK